jgi:outer membrane immunogenic protein
MRKIVSAFAFSLLTAGTAVAADMPLKAPPPPIAPVMMWTGFYVGLNGGYSWGRANTTLFPAAPLLAFPAGRDANGGVFGGQIGYNWQVDPKWVFGLEADGQWTGERGRRNDVLGSVRVPTPGNDFNIVTTTSADTEVSLPWFATFRGRVGLLANPSLLLYGTGGLAVGEVKLASQTTTVAQLFGPGSQGTIPAGPAVTLIGATFADSQTRVGWTVGAGVEKKFSQNWSAKLEYLYLDFGTKRYFDGTANQADVSFRDHILRAGINYQFGGPVVARY